jgi:hypothetical protein
MPDDDEGRHCRCCGVELVSAPARLLGVCITCVQFGGRQIPLPPVPGYGFNPTEATPRNADAR